MADYYPLLSRAVGALHDQSPEMRRAVYDRAKTALLDQLRSLDPPLSEADIEREQRSLEDTIRRIEAEQGTEDGKLDGVPVLAPEGEAPEVVPERRPVPQPEPRRRPNGTGQPRPPARPPTDDPADRVEPPQRDRPRIDTMGPSLERGGRGRTAILAGVIGLVIAGIAVAAWTLRDRPADLPATPGVSEPAQPAEGDAKLGGRVSGERASDTRSQSSGAPQAPRGDVAVAQRAILYEENPANPQQPKATAGRALWRLETANAGQGQPLEIVVRANVEVPGAGLSLQLAIRRNTDPTLPNSHTVEITFATPPGDPNRAVREIGPLQFKSEEAVRGTPLAGPAMPVRDNLFLMLLSNLDADVKRNTDLFLTRNWIDLPIRFAGGQRAIVSFEKGVSGDQVMADAVRQWQQ